MSISSAIARKNLKNLKMGLDPSKLSPEFLRKIQRASQTPKKDTVSLPGPLKGHYIKLPYPPSVNRYWHYGRRHVFLSEEGREYKRQVAMECLVENIKPLDGPVGLVIRLFRSRRAGDIDNGCKALLDALQGHAYHKDSQIYELHAFLRDDKANPRVEVSVTILRIP